MYRSNTLKLMIFLVVYLVTWVTPAADTPEAASDSAAPAPEQAEPAPSTEVTSPVAEASEPPSTPAPQPTPQETEQPKEQCTIKPVMTDAEIATCKRVAAVRD